MSASYHSAAGAGALPLPPPPPNPPPPGSAPVGTQGSVGVPQQPASPSQRRFLVQPPIITTALSAAALARTPSTASSATPYTPFSPYVGLTPATPASICPSPLSARTPSSMISNYNPQEWSRRGNAGGNYVPHSSTSTAVLARGTREATGMEASMPSPPPPYSPPAQQSIGQATAGSSPLVPSNTFMSPISNSASPATYSPATSSTSFRQRFSSGQDVHRNSVATASNSGTPVGGAAPAFPPPPGAARDRSGSRTRTGGQHSLFSLSGLRNRNADHSPAPNAIDALRYNTNEALAHAPGPSGAVQPPLYQPSGSVGVVAEQPRTPDITGMPPSARRAVSTGDIGRSAISSAAAARSREHSRSPSNAASWEPGMPLPPPPPGPPPPGGSRSVSASRASERSWSGSEGSSSRTSRETRPRPPRHASTLEPIPPTPAGWVDDDARNRSRSPAARGLQIDTSTQNTVNIQSAPARRNMRDADSSLSTTPSSAVQAMSAPVAAGSLARTHAKRDPSARGIRERRSESRAARDRTGESATEPSNNPWQRDMDAASPAKPADLDLSSSSSGGSGLARRRTITKSSPRSGGRLIPSPRINTRLNSNGEPVEEQNTPHSNHSTPRPESSRMVMSPERFGPTPPFSPHTGDDDNDAAARFKGPSPNAHPKTLPTPPPQRSSNDYLSTGVPEKQARPISHILHAPNNEGQAMPAPLVPSQPPSAGLQSNATDQNDRDDFAKSSIERHNAFVEKEMAARSDQERLELFAEFIVTESRMRRDRYSAAFEFMASDILDLTRDMWRSYGGGRRSATPTTSPRADEINSSTSDLNRIASNSASTTSNFTPQSEIESPSSTTSQGRAHAEKALWGGYRPQLSPIPSMNISTVPDEEDGSRGRTPSRWWESTSGSVGRGGKELERSKRESKYMGLPKEAREHLQWDGEPSPANSGLMPDASQQPYIYGPNEYPPEKTGWHEHQASSPALHYQNYTNSAPATPDPHKLDVSRLITLPPPYPRHYPALQNHHPDLQTTRTFLRTIQDQDDAQTIRDKYVEKWDAKRGEMAQDASERRAQLMEDVQARIRNGEISFAGAARAEADFEASEAHRKKDDVKAEYDLFQKNVFRPLYALHSERITKATASIDHLRNSLFAAQQAPTPNQTQEEGDEQPELLEKLTLLKWLFETREQLHKQLFDIEGERNDYYKKVVVTPYHAHGNQDKVKEAEEFFSKDLQDRRVKFEKEALKRFEEFAYVIEDNVMRGVEVQLSAFWDIAPGLLAVVQQVPSRNLAGFDIHIPADEYEENPSYYEYPLQYLFTLLMHAGKSAYQFIESQINLLCLLHEVKYGSMITSSRLMETQRYMAGEDFAEVDREMAEVRKDEDRRLTRDLKEKVELVEDQWKQALGKGLDDCKERVQGFLEDRGGWDESLRE